MTTEMQDIKRILLLKRQARRVILEEIREHEFKLALVKLKDELEKRMTKEFDQVLSRKLNCIIFLLKN